MTAYNKLFYCLHIMTYLTLCCGCLKSDKDPTMQLASSLRQCDAGSSPKREWYGPTEQGLWMTNVCSLGRSYYDKRGDTTNGNMWQPTQSRYKIHMIRDRHDLGIKQMIKMPQNWRLIYEGRSNTWIPCRNTIYLMEANFKHDCTKVINDIFTMMYSLAKRKASINSHF